MLTALGPQLNKRCSTPAGALLGREKAFLASVSAFMPQIGTHGTTQEDHSKAAVLPTTVASQSLLLSPVLCVFMYTFMPGLL